MALKPKEEIGAEVHKSDQFFRVEEGTGEAVLDGVRTPIRAGSAVVVPAGVNHNIINTQCPNEALYAHCAADHRDGRRTPYPRDAEATTNTSMAKRRNNEQGSAESLPLGLCGFPWVGEVFALKYGFAESSNGTSRAGATWGRITRQIPRTSRKSQNQGLCATRCPKSLPIIAMRVATVSCFSGPWAFLMLISDWQGYVVKLNGQAATVALCKVRVFPVR